MGIPFDPPSDPRPGGRRVEIFVAPPRHREPPPSGRTLRAGWVGIAVAVPLLAYAARSLVLGIALLPVLGAACLAVAALALAWSARTREWIAPATAGLMVAGSVAAVAYARPYWAGYDADVARMAAVAGRERVAQMERAAPLLHRAAVIHAARLTAEESAGFSQGLARRHGVDRGLPDTGFLSPEYLAHPAGFPQVAEWFASFRRYAAALRSEMGPYFAERMEAHLREAGIPVAAHGGLRSAVDAGMAAGGAQGGLDAMESLAASGLELDAYLRSIDGAVTVVDGQPRFRDRAQMEQVDRYLARMRAAQARIDALASPADAAPAAR